MTRLLTLITLLTGALSVLHAELKDVVFAPQWIPQAQFAGYYVAKEKGFFEQEGLNVTFNHVGINSKETSLELLKEGKAHIAGLQLMQAIVARAQGEPIVNVCQVTQISGLWVVAHRPIRELKDLNHMRVARWQSGHSELFDVLSHEFNLDIEWVPISRSVNLFIYGAVDATLCYSFNEYLGLLLSMGRIPEENVLRCHDHGPRVPEDGLYVTEQYYKDNKATIDAFVRATKKGWDYAAAHPEEACALSHRYVEAGHVSSNPVMERMMLKECLRLQVNPDTGKRDYAQATEEVFNKLVDAMYRAAVIMKTVNYQEMIRHE
ncbi:MAG: ABC transporter substrate-binding protein [Akkermansia sp.]|nr:ABC transporter substrate-binding protein [Akkermansia sp.]